MTRILHLHPTFCVGSGIDEVIRNLMKKTSTLGFTCELACFHAENAMLSSVTPSIVMVVDRPKYVLLLDTLFGLLPPPLNKVLFKQLPSFFSTYHFVKQRIDLSDIIHVHFYPFTAFSPLTKPKNKKLVIHNYGVTNNLSHLSVIEKLKLDAARRSEYLFSNADVVISISEFLRNDLYEHTGIESLVIPPGIDVDHFQYTSEGRNNIRRKYSIPADTFVILYVGRLIPYKRVDLLIEAFSSVKKELSNAKLIIASSPRCDKLPFEVQVEKLGLVKDVIFADDASFTNMPSYYSACDVNASCSVWEGFGLSFMEAAACGKPSVGFTGIPSLELLLEDGLGLGVKEKSVNAFAEQVVLSRSKNWDSHKLRIFSTDYSWDMVARKVTSVYCKIA